jgi:hypothetical protein
LEISILIDSNCAENRKTIPDTIENPGKNTSAYNTVECIIRNKNYNEATSSCSPFITEAIDWLDILKLLDIYSFYKSYSSAADVRVANTCSQLNTLKPAVNNLFRQRNESSASKTILKT